MPCPGPGDFKKGLQSLLLVQGVVRMLLPLFEYHLFELTQFQRLIFSLEFLKSALFKFCICRLHSLLWVFVHLLILGNAQHLDCLAYRACTCAFYLNPAAMQFKRKVLQVTGREKESFKHFQFHVNTLFALTCLYFPPAGWRGESPAQLSPLQPSSSPPSSSPAPP